ncbi:MAG: hypothetical protein FJX57_04840 [Alphaproteobacteria bacterium]|nr:hypothetical protein [Alphaproteobacteria bacterium]
MTSDDVTRKRRAEALRKRIEALKTGAPAAASRPETPSEFVHRRMQDLARSETAAKKPRAKRKR